MVLDAHYTHLMDLHKQATNTSSLRATYDPVEKHLSSLQSLGEDVHHRQIILIIRTKLQKVVIARLKQQKDLDEEWTVETLRKALKNCISAQDVVETQVHQQVQSSLIPPKDQSLITTGISK